MKLVKKIDIHAHVRSSGGLAAKFCPAETILDTYDAAGVEKAVLLPLYRDDWDFVTNPNREAMDAVSRYPDRFVWFCGVEAAQDENTDFTAILKGYQAMGAKGIGELISGVWFDDPRLWNLFRHAESCNMPVLFHIGDESGSYGVMDDFGLPRLEKTLAQFPNLKFFGHSTPWWSHISGDVTPEQLFAYPTGPIAPGGRVVELMRKYPNLCGDLSAGSGYNALDRDPEFAYGFLEEFQDRLYFGTDMITPDGGVTWKLTAFLDDAVTNGKISWDAYYKISRGNAEKLFGI